LKNHLKVFAHLPMLEEENIKNEEENRKLRNKCNVFSWC
jgi:hypothetical protein